MPQLVYPTLDLFLYELGESLGQDDHDRSGKRDNFKHQLPAAIHSQIEVNFEKEGEYVELLGEKPTHPLAKDEIYEGYYYPVKLSDSYGVLLDGSPRQQEQSCDNLQWVTELKNFVAQRLPVEKTELGRTWVFYAAVPEVPLADYEPIARRCYHALMPNTSAQDWEEYKTGVSDFTGGKLFECWHPGQYHLVILLFSTREILEEKMSDLIRDEMRLFEYRHKITWAYAQSRTLKQMLKAKAVEIQVCRKAFQNDEERSSLLKTANLVMSDYLSLLTGLESQGHTIETNLHNYQKRLLKWQGRLAGLSFPAVFKQEVEEKYLPQIRHDHASLSSSLKLIENIVASIHAQEMHKNVNHIAAVQTKVEWLEMFFVSFYAAEFTHLVIELSHKQSNFWENFSAILVAAIFAGGAAFLGLGLRKHFKFNRQFWKISGIVLAGILIIAMLLHC